ncbi:Hypothetical predicted protein, partial [Marmota monax]
RGAVPPGLAAAVAQTHPRGERVSQACPGCGCNLGPQLPVLCLSCGLTSSALADGRGAVVAPTAARREV